MLEVAKKINYGSTVINLENSSDIDNSSQEESQREPNGNEEQFGNWEYEVGQVPYINNHPEENLSNENQLAIDTNQYQNYNDQNEQSDEGEESENEAEDNEYFNGKLAF